MIYKIKTPNWSGLVPFGPHAEIYYPRQGRLAGIKDDLLKYVGLSEA